MMSYCSHTECIGDHTIVPSDGKKEERNLISFKLIHSQIFSPSAHFLRGPGYFELWHSEQPKFIYSDILGIKRKETSKGGGKECNSASGES